VFIVLPREKRKEVLAEERATLALIIGQEGDTTMLENYMVPYPNMEKLELNESMIDLQSNKKKSQIKPNDILAEQAKPSRHVELEPLAMEVVHFEQDMEP
jgi:hypothetical protein